MECHYCGTPLSLARELPEGAQHPTWDHIVPRALGGLDVRWNKTRSCKKCNSDKADTYPTHNCAICKRARRRHWEQLRIRDPRGDKHSKTKKPV